jgi:hypothetical protein
MQKSLQLVITMAQTLLQAQQGAVTAEAIAAKVKLAASVLAADFPEGIDEAAATKELIRRFSDKIGTDTALQDRDSGHDAWLNAARKKNWLYWQRYQTYLERKMSAEVVEALNKSTDRVLGLLEDPKKAGKWDRRGLVVGHVQSGKTGHYSGLICKAADAGYKVIIVLAGMHNNLRSQTQIRLEESFLGYETTENHDIPGKRVGVGEIDGDIKLRVNCPTTRANKGDFNSGVAKHFANSPEERPWLFVVKKNKRVLTQLLAWIRGHVADTKDSKTGKRIVSNLPLLVVDDESDNASVDTGELFFNADGTPDKEHEPKAINSLIRKILNAFDKSAYVGYTATPFANIFIHRKGDTVEEGPDLFPQSFIVNLAAPTNYVGPTKVFGLRSTEGREGGLPLMRIIPDPDFPNELSEWMPAKHNKEHAPAYAGQDIVPPSLKKAIQSFMLACAARTLRGQQRRRDRGRRAAPGKDGRRRRRHRVAQRAANRQRRPDDGGDLLREEEASRYGPQPRARARQDHRLEVAGSRDRGSVGLRHLALRQHPERRQAVGPLRQQAVPRRSREAVAFGLLPRRRGALVL